MIQIQVIICLLCLYGIQGLIKSLGLLYFCFTLLSFPYVGRESQNKLIDERTTIEMTSNKPEKSKGRSVSLKTF